MIRVLALPGGAALAASLAQRLACGHAELAVHRFPDGECGVRIPGSVRGAAVVLAGPLDRPDGRTLPLLFAADAARELGATRVGLVAPYLPYMRQDKRFHRGEAVTSRSYARLLSASLDFLVTADPHLHRWRALGDIYPIPTAAVAAAPAIAAWVRRRVPRPLLIGPDSESAQWVSQVAAKLDAPWAVLDKVRRGDTDVAVQLPRLPRGWRSLTPVLLDDIASSGHTLATAARALRGAGTGPCTCVVVHALLDERSAALLAAAGIDRFASCDTVSHPSNAIALGPALARAVRSLLPPT